MLAARSLCFPVIIQHFPSALLYCLCAFCVPSLCVSLFPQCVWSPVLGTPSCVLVSVPVFLYYLFILCTSVSACLSFPCVSQSVPCYLNLPACVSPVSLCVLMHSCYLLQHVLLPITSALQESLTCSWLWPTQESLRIARKFSPAVQHLQALVKTRQYLRPCTSALFRPLNSSKQTASWVLHVQLMTFPTIQPAATWSSSQPLSP